MPYQPTWINPYLQVPQIAPPPQPAIQQPVNGITMVNGPESAMQHQLPPNSTSEPMFDMNRQVFYVVSTAVDIPEAWATPIRFRPSAR